LCISEDAFHIKTEFVSVDFNDGAAAYDKIRPHLEHKDIGILGESLLMFSSSVPGITIIMHLYTTNCKQTYFTVVIDAVRHPLSNVNI